MKHIPLKRDKFGNVGELVSSIDTQMNRTIRSIEPVRQSAYRRFPVIFTLLTTVGAVATFLGIEKLLQQYEILGNYPWLMLCFGLSVLVLTGTLYKKLG